MKSGNDDDSSAYEALQSMFLCLVYELNESPDFPRQGLLRSLDRSIRLFEEAGKLQVADHLHRTAIALKVNLGEA